MLELGIGIQGAKPIVSGSGLADPLGTVKAISSLIEAGHMRIHTRCEHIRKHSERCAGDRHRIGHFEEGAPVN